MDPPDSDHPEVDPVHIADGDHEGEAVHENPNVVSVEPITKGANAYLGEVKDTTANVVRAGRETVVVSFVNEIFVIIEGREGPHYSRDTSGDAVLVYSLHTACDYDKVSPVKRSDISCLSETETNKKHGEGIALPITIYLHENTSLTTTDNTHTTDSVKVVTEENGSELSLCLACGGIDGVCPLPTGSFRLNSGIGGHGPYGLPEYTLAEGTEIVANTTKLTAKYASTSVDVRPRRWLAITYNQ